MKNNKRFLCIILSLLIALNIFCSCNHSDDSEHKNGSDNSTETTEAITTEKPLEIATIPDIDFYFNTAPSGANGEYNVYSFNGNPTEAVKNYVSLLQNKYNMTLYESYEEETTLMWRLQKGDNENACVDISIDSTGDISWELWIRFGSNTKLSAAETWDKPIVPTLSGPTLPSPDAFFDNRLARNEDFYSEQKERYILSFKADIDTGSLAMQEYISLLFDEKFKLELTFEEEETILYLHQYHYAFTYTGEEDIPDVIDDNNDIQGDVLVYMQRNGQTETSLLTFYFKPDVFEFIDFGDRTTYSPIDYSGKNTSSDIPNSGGNNVSQECNVCDGSGECTTCNGDGYLHSSASDEEDRNCYKCHPNYGKCPACHGTGRRN